MAIYSITRLIVFIDNKLLKNLKRFQVLLDEEIFV